MDPKTNVIRSFLDLGFRTVPSTEAFVATLGGVGLEAALWKELGVQPDHGRLIERHRKRNRQLIRSHNYRVHNELGSVAKVLGATGETVDAFHLDLCGTFDDDAAKNLLSVLPFVIHSKGKCIAITVADARRNVVLDEWDSFFRKAHKLLGNEADSTLATLLEEQKRVPVKKHEDLPKFFQQNGFDVEKGAKREFGVLVELLKVFRRGRFWYLPSSMERHIYVSRFSGKAFRMRTYFFKLEGTGARNFEKRFIERWLASPLHYSNGNGFELVTDVEPRIEIAEKGIKMTSSKLAEMVALAGPEVQEEYKSLLKAQVFFSAFHKALEEANQSVGDPAPRKPVKTNGTGHGASETKRRKSWDEATDLEQIHMTFEMFDAYAKANGNEKEWYKLKEQIVRKTLNTYSKELGRSAGAAFARARGRHQKLFIERLKRVLGEADAGPMIDRLRKYD